MLKELVIDNVIWACIYDIDWIGKSFTCALRDPRRVRILHVTEMSMSLISSSPVCRRALENPRRTT